MKSEIAIVFHSSCHSLKSLQGRGEGASSHIKVTGVLVVPLRVFSFKKVSDVALAESKGYIYDSAF